VSPNLLWIWSWLNFKNASYCSASLQVRTELYSCRTWSSRSFSMRSQIMLTCRKVKIGMSFLLGERALNSEVDEDPEGRSNIDDWDVDSWGGDIFGGLGHPGYCSCFLLCILLISRLRFEAICSEDNLGPTSPNGDGWIWCCFVGGVDGDKVIGIHLRRFGVVWPGLCNGSKSRDLFSVAPQAIFVDGYGLKKV